MKIAVFQMSAFDHPDAKIDLIENAMRKAAANGADILVTPELALTGYGRGKALQTQAQPNDGPWVERLKASVSEIGISLVVGFPEREGDTCFISALVVDKENPNNPQFYRKGTLYSDYEKDLFQTHGPSTVLAELDGLKFGFLICYDIEFPENVRRLALAGAQVVIVPTALAKCDAGIFIARNVIPVRAFENQIFVAYANHADEDERFKYQGLSSIAAPDGQVLAEAPISGNALIYAQIEPENYKQTRIENPYLNDCHNVF